MPLNPERASCHPASADRALVRGLLRWLANNARPFPWRTAPPGRRDPYVVLVSEVMLQQTQASRVAVLLPRFLDRFPSIEALAAASEDEVLALWSGLGYYRRARMLHAAARACLVQYEGRIPTDPEALQGLPGIGRYTGGAIASLAFGLPEPLVDGNVARVLLRLEGRPGVAGSPEVTRWSWKRAAELVQAAPNSAPAFNEALMELGATICTPAPRAPQCDVCPLRAGCKARQTGQSVSIPAPQPSKSLRRIYATTIVLVLSGNRTVIEQRPARGLWASLWQAPTLEHERRHCTKQEAAAALHLEAGSLHPGPAYTHRTTHREICFQVWKARVRPGHLAACLRTVVRADQLGDFGLSSAQRRILDSVLG
ncbi:MAG: A/G-specific adenine glycosylase [Phycisphaeraceae bacterium]|nr:A/G-specific adenine glycosylase [Phycisphaeraceae bacterium]